MSVPNHHPSCRSLTYPAECWDCGEPIFIFQCSCGSTVLFDQLGWPWPQHDCGGERLPTGWDVIDKLRAMGVPIDARVMAYAFGKTPGESKPKAPPPIVAIKPTHGKTADVIGIIRNIDFNTKLTKDLDNVGRVGLEMLRLRGKVDYGQITIHDTSEEPAASYTCIVPNRQQLKRYAIGELVGLQVRGAVFGSFGFWVVENIERL